MSYARRCVRAGMALTMMGVLGWLGGCSDDPSGPVDPAPPLGLLVSDPVSAAGLTPAAVSSSALSSAVGDDVAYVSLPPGTVPNGSTATIRRVGDAGSIITAVSNGGFDPVPVTAQAGDFIEALVRDAAGGIVLQARLAVAAARPPIVVRTDPPRKKTDVPLNAAIVIVFSEPVDGGTLTASSVRVLRGTSTVAGTVTLLQGTGALAAFVPTAPLAANTDYRLEVTMAVRDLAGDALAAGVMVEFTTGQSLTGPPASIRISPDSMLSVAVGATYQLTATVLDAGGNVLVDHPVTWSSSDQNLMTVSSTGLVTAIEPGSARVTASVDELSKGLSVSVQAGPPASLTIAPTSAVVAAGDTVFLTATARDAAGHVTSASITWTSSDSSVATVGTGLGGRGAVVGVSPGDVTIMATIGTLTATVPVTVGPPRPVASVTVTPNPATLVVRGRAQLTATLRDASGGTISGRPITWMIDNPAVAIVNSSGLVGGVSLGSAAVIASSEGVSDTAAITVKTITFATVSAGGPDYFPRRYPPLGLPLAVGAHTCGLTSEGAAYCWGGATLQWVDFPEDEGDDGWYFSLDFGVPIAVGGDLRFVTLVTGVDGSLGRTADGPWYRWWTGGSEYPVNPQPSYEANTVAISIPKAQYEYQFTCSDNLCWGIPPNHECRLTAGGAAYCGGFNRYGQVGNGSEEDISSGPVAGGHTFSTVGVGAVHTCGLTTSGIAYCWGGNNRGQLGDGSAGFSNVPVPVAGGLSFTALSVGAYHACALSATGEAYCWGGTSGSSSVPQAVGGGLSFVALTLGEAHSCALTASGAAYCWGANAHGQLGDGSTINSSVPVAVAGGLSFSSLSAGSQHTCGVTTTGTAYCWGWNSVGQLGDGSSDAYSNVPVKVAGQP